MHQAMTKNVTRKVRACSRIFLTIASIHLTSLTATLLPFLRAHRSTISEDFLSPSSYVCDPEEPSGRLELPIPQTATESNWRPLSLFGQTRVG